MRLSGLDGLRGVAALIVVIHHSLLLFPTMSAVYLTGTAPVAGSLMWWMSYSPLKVLSAGGEAVIVFFVLSGLVLTLLVTKRAGFDWVAYFPRRAVRIWLPVAASVIFAFLLVTLVRQQPFQPGTTWLNRSSIVEPTWATLVNASTLFGGNFQLNNPLWSLQWEMIFSVCLPLFVLCALAFRRWWIAGVAVAILLAWVGVLGAIPALHYLPVFLAGGFLAVGLPGIQRVAARLNGSGVGRWLWPSVLVVAVAALLGPWLIGPSLRSIDWALNLATLVVPLAAVAIVVCAIGWPLLARVLSAGVFKFLGTISFSLYLVHVPILVFASYALKGLPQPAVVVIAVPCSIVVAALFYRFVERSSHVWSRRIGDWASAVFARSTSPAAAEPTAAETVIASAQPADPSAHPRGRAGAGASHASPVA